MKIGQLFSNRENGASAPAQGDTVPRRIYDDRVQERDAALQRAINAEYRLAILGNKSG